MIAVSLRRYLPVVFMVLMPAAAHAQGGKAKAAPLTPEQCTEFRAHYSPDSTTKGVRPAEVTRTIVLPKAPQDDVGREMELRVLVNSRGAVDSVQVRGTVSSTFEERLRVQLMRYNFKPATYQGCAVPFWMTFRVTP